MSNINITFSPEDTIRYKSWLTSCYSKICVKRPLPKRLKIDFQDQLSLNAGQKYCRMLQGEHSAIHLTFIKLPFVIKIFVLSIFECPFYTGFTVHYFCVSLFSCFVFVWFDSLRPINNLSVKQGWVFLGWTSTKLGLMFLLKDTTQWRRWGWNPRLSVSSQALYQKVSSLAIYT